MVKPEVLRDSQDLIDTLEAIIAYEDKERARIQKMGWDPNVGTSWELLDVPTTYQPVAKLVLAGFLQKTGKKRYALIDHEEAKAILEEVKMEREEQAIEMEAGLDLEMLRHLFDNIVGYEDLKNLFVTSLAADNPVHIFLVGPPGTAKSLFMMDIEKLGATMITAGTSTKAGIQEVLCDTPRILLVDELDKIASSKDLNALLTWMEQGKVYITKHGYNECFSGKGWVFAAANSLRGVPPELKDRFIVMHLQPYQPEEFVTVVSHYLVSEGVDAELAKYIATKVKEYSSSVREAVRLSRLCKTTQQVDATIAVIRKYR